MAANVPDVLSESRLSVAQLAKRITGGGAPLSAQRKVRRWIEQGVTVRGAVVKLDAAREGGRYVTSAEAYERFIAACNLRPEPARTPGQVRRAGEKASKALGALLRRTGASKPLADGQG